MPKNGDTPGMRFSEGVDKPNAPYVLLVGGPFEKTRRTAKDGYLAPAFHAVGWMWGHECIRPEFETIYSNPDSTRRKFLVPQTSLRSMEEISVSV